MNFTWNQNPLSRFWERVRVMANSIFASGGLKDGLDIAKCLALGATLGRMASQFLKAAAVSTEKVNGIIRQTQRQI
jgi:isopentenyl diphosphate isomerase/L-lactate dehydrogenase-like FMN-dependent dehydrogenase